MGSSGKLGPSSYFSSMGRWAPYCITNLAHHHISPAWADGPLIVSQTWSFIIFLKHGLIGPLLYHKLGPSSYVRPISTSSRRPWSPTHLLLSLALPRRKSQI